MSVNSSYSAGELRPNYSAFSFRQHKQPENCNPGMYVTSEANFAVRTSASPPVLQMAVSYAFLFFCSLIFMHLLL